MQLKATPLLEEGPLLLLPYDKQWLHHFNNNLKWGVFKYILIKGLLMNIINFSKAKHSEDANGEYGPHVRWYQEEVHPRWRKRYLVSLKLNPTCHGGELLFTYIAEFVRFCTKLDQRTPLSIYLNNMRSVQYGSRIQVQYIWQTNPFTNCIASPERMRAPPARPFSTSSARTRSSYSETAWTQTTTMKISACPPRISSTNAPPLPSRRWTPSPSGSSEDPFAAESVMISGHRRLARRGRALGSSWLTFKGALQGYRAKAGSLIQAFS